MANTADLTQQAPKHIRRKVAVGVAALFGLAAVSGGIAACGGGTTAVIKQAPGPVKTVTAPAPAKSAPAKSAPVSSTVLNYSGSGTAQTPAFTVPGGDYNVSWSFSGNDGQGTGADNFILQEDGGNDFNASTSLPNLIQASGSGNTGVTGDTGTHSFDVQADSSASWTVKVVAGNGAQPATAPAAPTTQPAAVPAATTPPPAPQAAAPGADPWTVVSQYYGDIESGDFAAAWALQSPAYQASNGSLAGWEVGYQYTGAQSITENSESGGTVSFNLSAVDNNAIDDPTQYFSCQFAVDQSSGLITSGACTQTGES
jgi:hypothetical protein